ncbi:hypothetical protein ZWY2020_009342 [Hordeum vulgare]|nr:hypothetical protein ZWY2020_009342 [Hordeum vulgare]
METARNVKEVVQKLASDRARLRDLLLQEGVKLLGTWLQGNRALTFCRLLARNAVRAKPVPSMSPLRRICELSRGQGEATAADAPLVMGPGDKGSRRAPDPHP